MVPGEERLYTVYLAKKKGAEEVTYGPFQVDLNGWISTGLYIKKGSSFRITGKGELTYTKDGETRKIYPGGDGMRGWWSLKAKVGSTIIDIGESGSGTGIEDGMLHLGAPRVEEFYKEDAKGVSGAWTVYVFSKNAERKFDINSPEFKSKLEKAKNDLLFLKQVEKRDSILLKDKNDYEISQRVRNIINGNKLPMSAMTSDVEAGVKLVKLSFYRLINQGGDLDASDKVKFESFLETVIGQLEDKIEKLDF